MRKYLCIVLALSLVILNTFGLKISAQKVKNESSEGYYVITIKAPEEIIKYAKQNIAKYK